MTHEELIAKYPKIFVPYEGNPDGINWGVPHGWLPIIDKLCGAIQDYINHVKYNQPNPEYVEGREYVKGDLTTYKNIMVSPSQVECLQMKEKFGGLRFYTNGHDEIIEGMITFAEYLCDNTCDNCGGEEDLGYTKGWITVKCRTCAQGMNWTPKT